MEQPPSLSLILPFPLPPKKNLENIQMCIYLIFKKP